MGAPETATRRLNLAQAFNPIGSLTGMTVASLFILSNLQVEELRTDYNGYQSENGNGAIVQSEHYVLPIFQAKQKERLQDPVLASYLAANPEAGLDQTLA